LSFLRHALTRSSVTISFEEGRPSSGRQSVGFLLIDFGLVLCGLLWVSISASGFHGFLGFGASFY
jgi:hypothetical protein